MASILDQIKAGTLKVVPVYQVEIPPTSKNLYITGYYALNIPAPEGTSGDWHNPYWYKDPKKPRKITLAGTGLDWNTNPYLGDYGVYEGKDRLQKHGIKTNEKITEVYIANHFRAILDLLYRDIRFFGRCDTLKYATSDWLDTQEQKDLLLEKAVLLLDAFEGKNRQTLLNWIETERALEL